MNKRIFDFNNAVIINDMAGIYARPFDWKSIDSKTFLITGAYGMLASYIVFYLMYLNIYQNYNIRVITQGRSIEKAKQRFSEFWEHKNFTFIDDDIIDRKLSFDDDIDYIFHTASLASPQYYSVMPVEVIEPNVIGTYNLLKLAVSKKASGFLFFSSGDIYGKVSEPGNIEETTVGTMDPLDEHSCYGESKRLGETFCTAFYREYGVRTVIARIGHTYGPTMNITDDPRVFADFMRCILGQRDITINSDGLTMRPFCYIADAVYAFFLILMRGKGGEAYNMTNTDQFISIKELAEIISEIPPQKVGIIYKKRESSSTYLENRLNTVNKPIETKLKALGWNAEITVKDGFTRVYEYWKSIFGEVVI